MKQENKVTPQPEEGKFGFIVSFPSANDQQTASEPAPAAVQPAAAPAAAESSE